MHCIPAVRVWRGVGDNQSGPAGTCFAGFHIPEIARRGGYSPAFHPSLTQPNTSHHTPSTAVHTILSRTNSAVSLCLNSITKHPLRSVTSPHSPLLHCTRSTTGRYATLTPPVPFAHHAHARHPTPQHCPPVQTAFQRIRCPAGASSLSLLFGNTTTPPGRITVIASRCHAPDLISPSDHGVAHHSLRARHVADEPRRLAARRVPAPLVQGVRALQDQADAV